VLYCVTFFARSYRCWVPYGNFGPKRVVPGV
jgi:hypothetical protein